MEIPSGGLPVANTRLKSGLLDSIPDIAREHAGFYLDAAFKIGQRTGEMHIALAEPTSDPAFAPEVLTHEDLEMLRRDLSRHAANAFQALRESITKVPDDLVDSAALVLSRRGAVVERFSSSLRRRVPRAPNAHSRRFSFRTTPAVKGRFLHH